MSQPKAHRSHNAIEIAAELQKFMAHEAGAIEARSSVKRQMDAYIKAEENLGHGNVSLAMVRKWVDLIC